MNIPIDDLTLRELTKEDTLPFFELIDCNRTRLKDFFPKTIASVINPETCADFVSNKMEEEAKKECYSFVLADEAGKLQGYISIKNVDWTVPKCELAYFIDKAHEGKRIMTRAIAAILEHCFGELHMNKVYLVTAIDNYASRKIAKKNGFELEGILRNNFKMASGGLIDMAWYGILKRKSP